MSDVPCGSSTGNATLPPQMRYLPASDHEVSGVSIVWVPQFSAGSRAPVAA